MFFLVKSDTEWWPSLPFPFLYWWHHHLFVLFHCPKKDLLCREKTIFCTDFVHCRAGLLELVGTREQGKGATVPPYFCRSISTRGVNGISRDWRNSENLASLISNKAEDYSKHINFRHSQPCIFRPFYGPLEQNECQKGYMLKVGANWYLAHRM